MRARGVAHKPEGILSYRVDVKKKAENERGVAHKPQGILSYRVGVKKNTGTERGVAHKPQGILSYRVGVKEILIPSKMCVGNAQFSFSFNLYYIIRYKS